MTGVRTRLTEFISYLGISVNSFEKSCKLSPGTVSRLTTNSYAYTYSKIARTFPQLNIDWLKTGEGEMLHPQFVGDTITQKGNNNVAKFSGDGNSFDTAAVHALMNDLETQRKITERCLNIVENFQNEFAEVKKLLAQLLTTAK